MDVVSLRLIHSYLTDKYQRVRVYSGSSLWSKINNGVTQGSVLGTLLFNVYLADLFLFMIDENIAHDSTPYALENDIDMVIQKLQNDTLFLWFSQNTMKANPDKSHLLISCKDLNLPPIIGGNVIPNENNVKLLGVTFDNFLSFDTHVSSLCNKATQKLHVLSRVSWYEPRKNIASNKSFYPVPIRLLSPNLDACPAN